MKISWHVIVPVWGGWHTRLFLEHCLPAIRKAAEGISHQWTLTVHTDRPKIILDAVGDLQASVQRIKPGENRYQTLGDLHRDTINERLTGEAIAFINADMVPSREVFSAAEARFRQGKRLIMCAAPRTNANTFKPKPGVPGRHLATWAWWHRHDWISDCIYGEGHTKVPSNIFFRRSIPELHAESADRVVMHGFHLHPFALMKDHPLTFRGVTIDADLVDSVPRYRTHVVTDPDELAFAEMSAPGHGFGSTKEKLGAGYAAYWARHNASAGHQWMFGHQIVIRGEKMQDAQDEADYILRQINAFDRERMIAMVPDRLRYMVSPAIRKKIRGMLGAVQPGA